MPKRWLSGVILDLGLLGIEELLIDWMTPVLAKEDSDRLVGWHLGVSL